MKKAIILLLLIIVLAIASFFVITRNSENAAVSEDGVSLEEIQSEKTDDEDEENDDTPVIDEEPLDDGDEESRSDDELDTVATTSTEIDAADYDISTELEAITDDAATGTESGIAMARYTADNLYELDAAFDGLPELDADEYFYEGWIVRRDGELSVISTGPLEMDADGNYINHYTSDENLLDHTEYVLTLEPNDGDPAPAAHVLEGIMQ